MHVLYRVPRAPRDEHLVAGLDDDLGVTHGHLQASLEHGRFVQRIANDLLRDDALAEDVAKTSEVGT